MLKILKFLFPAVFISILFAGSASASSAGDNYETDNSAQTASIYYLFSTGVQVHDFHAQADEDWIQFSTRIDFDAVEIMTYEPEQNCETIITLFDADKTTQLKEQKFTLSSGKCLMSFKPDKDGTYYVRIKNKDSSKFGSDTGYKLAIYFPVAPFSGTVVGTVSDSATGSPVESVKIVTENNYSAAVTDADGFYFLQCPAGQFTLYASKSGYNNDSKDMEVIELGNTEINFQLNQIQKNHAVLNQALEMTIPCIELNNTCYQITLNQFTNPSDGSGFYWKLDPGSVDINQDCINDCALMDNDFTIAIPKIEYNGSFFQINLKQYNNSADPSGFYWKLDLTSVKTL